MITDKRLFITGILGAKGVALGAMCAHFLKSKVTDGTITTDQLNGFETGVKYHMLHAIVMLVIVLLSKTSQNKYFNWAFNLFFVGIFLFSGSLYFLCTRHLFGAEWLKILGPVTPIGGVCLILGWLCLSIASLNSVKNG